MPPQPFLQLTVNRVHNALDRLERRIWTPCAAQPEVAATSPQAEVLPLAAARDLPLTPLAPPEHWGRQLYDQRWFRVNLPAASDPRPRYLKWVDVAGATAWQGDLPFYGFDVCHRICPEPIGDGATEFWLEALCLSPFLPNSPIDPAGSRCEGATLLHRDDAAWRAWHDLRVLVDLAMEERRVVWPELGKEPKWIGHQPVIENLPPGFRRLLRGLDDAVIALDSGGLPALQPVLDRLYDEFSSAEAPLICTLVGHAHIDLVWLWPERVSEHKAMHTFSTVNRLMGLYPELRFSYSQSASYRAVAARAPRLHDAVRARIGEGRWEATGGGEVECDTLVPCGEALLRNFLLGQKEFAALTGAPSRLLWLPDVFGYAGCLPRIMRECGMDYFFTTKLHWNALTKFPYSSFHWEGTDGTRVLAHVSHDVGYNGTVDLAEIRLGAEAYRQADVHDEYLAPTGYGDGGGGPTEIMCERARRAARLRGMPEVQWDVATPYFDRLATVADQLPVYHGELYLEYHRGTYTTHSALKLAYRQAERALQILEAVATSTGHAPDTLAAWRRVVFAQFHDYLPGSSLPPVYAEALAELAALIAKSHADSADLLAQSTGEPCLFNPLPQPVVAFTAAGARLALPPLSGRPESDADATPALLEASPTVLRSDRVEATFDAAGALLTLRIDGREVRLTAPAARLIVYPDHAPIFHAWDLERQCLEAGQFVETPATIDADLAADRAEIAVARPVGTASHATVRYIVRPGRPALEIEIDVDWQEPEATLKLSLPTGYRGRMARFGAPFGSILRSQAAGEIKDEAMWEVPASRWAALTDDAGTAGLWLAAESKYGYRAREGTLDVTLLRSPLHTGAPGEAHAFMYPEALRGEHPPATPHDLGPHHIRLAVGAFDPLAPRERQPAALAESLFANPVPYQGAPIASGLLGLEGGETLVASWAKPADDGTGWILRLHETLGIPGEVTLSLAPGWTARRVDARENTLDEAAPQTFVFAAYDLVSLHLVRE